LRRLNRIGESSDALLVFFTQRRAATSRTAVALEHRPPPSTVSLFDREGGSCKHERRSSSDF
jgi:hypothetical protein